MSLIKLNYKSYIHNLNQILNKLNSKNRIILVIKDNAYGHGIDLIARESSKFGIKFCAVKNIDEASQVREFYENILVLSHIFNGNENQRYIYSINDFKQLSIVKQGTNVHLAIDTLMHRNGIKFDEIYLAYELANKRKINISGIYTHFMASDEIDATYYIQKSIFENVKKNVTEIYKKFNMPKPIFHSHNSAALERSMIIDDDMVRVGMAQYGYCQFNDSLNLKPVLSLWANKISERILKKDQAIGYGGIFVAKKDMKIATYDLGYGDGLFRYDGKNKLKLACGVNLLGKMSMDSFSCLDMGDEICVFDDARIWASFFKTISYDVLAKLSPFIKRQWF